MKTPAELKRIWQTNPDGLAQAFGNMLREFGYDSVTNEYVKKCIARYYDGEPAQKTNIIDMFVRDYLAKGTM